MSEVVKPLCSCGNEGRFRVRIDVAELKLIEGRWQDAFPPSSSIQSVMCMDCMKANVSVTTRVVAQTLTEN